MTTLVIIISSFPVQASHSHSKNAATLLFLQLSFGFGFREAGEFAADLKEGGALGEHDLIFAGFDSFHVGVAGLNPYLGALQQEFQLTRDFAEAIAELPAPGFYRR